MFTTENLQAKCLKVLQALAGFECASFEVLAERTHLPVHECAYLAGLLVGEGRAVGVFDGHTGNLLGISLTREGSAALVELMTQAGRLPAGHKLQERRRK